jgi:hypothetical protein
MGVPDETVSPEAIVEPCHLQFSFGGRMRSIESWNCHIRCFVAFLLLLFCMRFTDSFLGEDHALSPTW